MKPAVNIKEGYIVEDGKKKAAVIPIESYRGLLKKIEDLEDALNARKEAKEFLKYSDVRKELKAKGRL